ncbi:hypothetical protein ppKF707_4719 [Metapseudomonas furukawaii]|uniref:Uncharacterized protein n=1 Tax=Metapseudomonas furukawaii TaxID=1149133 RepID=A0AAD1FFX9_METFU|nr:hypothetical protein ppKF707_4719 [Pseudomonas furukawaii]BAU74936.1 hypothetical protein KF707C_32480 [Pseudomonas furukawaii]
MDRRFHKIGGHGITLSDGACFRVARHLVHRRSCPNSSSDTAQFRHRAKRPLPLDSRHPSRSLSDEHT